MKKVLSIIALAAILFSCQKEEPIAVDQQGSESNVKTAYTCTTVALLTSALSKAKAGDVITISGTLKPTATLKCSASGTSSSKITLQGGTLDFSGMSVSSSNRGISLSGSYWVIKNMAINKAGDNGIVVQTGGYNTISGVTVTGCYDSGIQIYNSSHDNSVTGCKSNSNYDTQNGGENADGFACKLSAGKNNKFTSCSATKNSDDGWDLYGQPYTVVMTSCTATYHGQGANGDGNGFKLGSSGQSVPHTVTYCTSSYNKGCGYTGNGNTGHMTTTGSTGTGNTKALWDRIY
jgi:hypothetical protein